MSLFTASSLSALVAIGPPVVLVGTLSVILWKTSKGRISVKLALVISAIAAVFFLMWVFTIPKLYERQVIIVTSNKPAELQRVSLKPILLTFGTRKDLPLDNVNFTLPLESQPLNVELNLSELVTSYEKNLETVVKFAQGDSECFERVSRGVSYASLAGRLEQECSETALIRPGAYE